jgi:hypothetical protein
MTKTQHFTTKESIFGKTLLFLKLVKSFFFENWNFRFFKKHCEQVLTVKKTFCSEWTIFGLDKFFSTKIVCFCYFWFPDDFFGQAIHAWTEGGFGLFSKSSKLRLWVYMKIFFRSGKNKI